MKRGGAEDSIVSLAMKRMRTVPMPARDEALKPGPLCASSAAKECCALACEEAYARGCADTHAALMTLLEGEFLEIERQARAAAMADYEEDRRARCLRMCYVPFHPADAWQQPWQQPSGVRLL